MPGNPQQMMALIDRLHDLTTRGQLKWSQSSEKGKHHIRVGEHLVEISEPQTGIPMSTPSATLTVTRLDGSLVDEVYSGHANIFANKLGANYTQISQPHQQKLADLYRMITDNSVELAELLRALGAPTTRGKVP